MVCKCDGVVAWVILTCWFLRSFLSWYERSCSDPQSLTIEGVYIVHQHIPLLHASHIHHGPVIILLTLLFCLAVAVHFFCVHVFPHCQHTIRPDVGLNITSLKYFFLNQFFFKFQITINCLVSLFPSCEYLCYESAAIMNISILSARGPSLYVRIWRLQTSDSDI